MPIFGGTSVASEPPGGWQRGDLATDVVADLDKAASAITQAEKGAPSGVATLDEAGLVPAALLPDTTTTDSTRIVLGANVSAATYPDGTLILDTEG